MAFEHGLTYFIAYNKTQRIFPFNRKSTIFGSLSHILGVYGLLSTIAELLITAIYLDSICTRLHGPFVYVDVA